jgi:hypothetical protein
MKQLPQPIADALLRLALQAESAGLPYLIIGGNAMAHYGLPRFTRDIDFLIPQSHAQNWTDMLKKEGYECYSEAGAFMQFEYPLQALAPVDLLLVNEETWQKLYASARHEPIEEGALAWWPLPLHLIALKLHAWRSPHRENRQQDWQDLTGLMRQFQLNPKNPEVTEIILRYGGESALQKRTQNP